MRKIPKSIIRDCVKNFFPRWKAWKNWRFDYGKLSEGIGGACAKECKIILICPENDPQLKVQLKKGTFTIEVGGSAVNGKDLERSYLVHEMCHAVTGRSHGSHGKRFFQRLGKCKVRAESLGDKKLAALIIDQLGAHDLKESDGSGEPAYELIDDKGNVLTNRGEGKTHPKIREILRKLRTQNRVLTKDVSITLFDRNDRIVVLMLGEPEVIEYEQEGFDWKSQIDVQTIDYHDGGMVVTRQGRKPKMEIIPPSRDRRRRE
jgi:hypothetical protein